MQGAGPVSVTLGESLSLYVWSRCVTQSTELEDHRFHPFLGLSWDPLPASSHHFFPWVVLVGTCTPVATGQSWGCVGTKVAPAKSCKRAKNSSSIAHLGSPSFLLIGKRILAKSLRPRELLMGC